MEVQGWRWALGGGVVVHSLGRLAQRALEALCPADVERALAAAPDRAMLRRDFVLYHASTVTSLGMFLWSAALSARIVAVGVRRRGVRGFLREPPLDDAFTVRSTRRMLFVLGGHLLQDLLSLHATLLRDRDVLLHHVLGIAVTFSFASMGAGTAPNAERADDAEPPAGAVLGVAAPVLLVELSTVLLNLAWVARRLDRPDLAGRLMLAFALLFAVLRLIYLPLFLGWVNVCDPRLINRHRVAATALYGIVLLQFFWGSKILRIAVTSALKARLE